MTKAHPKDPGLVDRTGPSDCIAACIDGAPVWGACADARPPEDVVAEPTGFIRTDLLGAASPDSIGNAVARHTGCHADLTRAALSVLARCELLRWSRPFPTRSSGLLRSRSDGTE
jgi:hypothetical protein